MLSQETRAGRGVISRHLFNMTEINMDLTQCPSLASLLTHGQQITHRQHQRGWI